ncbi:triple QxxK/R motif-containing protein-like [Macrobrachium nipponense]|uniref:triple QxxK/R motif-containing protein-like n=1 Tax=Macrobrachium nipponense TaxID=159736 RepID=UPI0030C84DBC
MGKKDCQTSRLPVDHYRKQIGKQNRKHTTVDVKKIKKQNEMKRKTTKVYKDVKVIVSGFLGAAILVYGAMLLWFYATEGYNQ